MQPPRQSGVQAIGQEGDEDMRFDPGLVLMEDRPGARPAGAPPNPTAPWLERRPRDPFVRTGRPTPGWRRYSRIRSAPRSLSRLDDPPPSSHLAIEIN